MKRHPRQAARRSPRVDRQAVRRRSASARVESRQPESWLPQGDEVRVHSWARRWLAEQWPEWQPRTRNCN
jgi:hypothetical protein